VYYLGDIIFSDYLRRAGFTYLAVQWARLVTSELGADYGMVKDGRDGYEIIFLLQEDYDAYVQAAPWWRETLGSSNATRAQ
jgi:hypothetical protein